MPFDHDVLPAFAIVRFRRAPGAPPEPGVLADGRVHPLDLAGLGAASLNELFERWDALEQQVRATRAPDGGLALDDVVLAAPVEPRQVLQTGANYRTHVIDLDLAHRPKDDPRSEEQARAEIARIMDDRAAHGEPYFFIGLPQTVVGEDQELVLPGYSDRHDWELELAAIIGRETFRVSREDALEHVWGWTIVNDITTRDLVFRRDMPAIGTDWYRGKNARGFNPTGPFAVPRSDAPAPDSFAIRLDLNGETMQDATSDDLLFDVPALVSSASRILPLLPGDLLLTGSPAGNGQARGVFLKPGDRMTGSITALGTQRVTCIAEEAR
ncbi:fumarylacetoacetate hydrolase family protein [Amnibacterium sp. CER49]|uniref:fumarylacetoacetate hydrolase family protein n=1 Tax=Amnibacterium sp. CER49 TaxID=3039161 RepID=UPI00244C2859|nr:fumarylacetoacetate hydrolase family protein [Amnibacterium sp. CER49]MDH2444879.1 fumarylacetoacetate hydrolase family protein [Amnibacterium sp. CER49]